MQPLVTYWRICDKLLYSRYNQTVMKYLLMVNWPYLLLWIISHAARIGWECWVVELRILGLLPWVEVYFIENSESGQTTETCKLKLLQMSFWQWVISHLPGYKVMKPFKPHWGVIFLILSSDSDNFWHVIISLTDLFASDIGLASEK